MIWRVSFYRYSTEHRCTGPIETVFIQAETEEDAISVIKEDVTEVQTCITLVKESSEEEVLKSYIINYKQ